jgi:MFS transporter, putative metabolite:H+ symporter
VRVLQISRAHQIGSGEIGARLDRLPATRTIWTYVLLLSLGGFFEYYDLFFTGYIAPGLVRSGILTATTHGLFGTTGVASFVAAMFSGLFLGTAVFGFVADRFGRRTIFTCSLLWYTAASIVMAFQNDVFGLNLWRFVSGIGVGVELVTIDSYLSELVPKQLRGRAFAYNATIQFCAVPLVALLAWLLVPRAPLGLDGWRWVVLIGAASAIFVWWIRRRVPESPRWLAQHGRIEEANRILAELEARVSAESGRTLPAPENMESQPGRGKFIELWRPPYLRRTVMLTIFNFFQTIGFYGFSNWVPTLLIQRGIAVTNSLRYTFIIAIAAPFGPLFAATLADKFERKWQIVLAALAVALSGLAFGQTTAASILITFGVLLTLANNIMSYSFHAYQAELYPTRIRALAVGFVYSWSRLSVVFTSFVIAFFLDRFGVAGVFALIAGSMAVVMVTIGWQGPRTNNQALEIISS